MRFTTITPLGMLAQSYVFFETFMARRNTQEVPLVQVEELTPIPDDVVIEEMFVACGQDSDVVLRTAVVVGPEAEYFIKEALQSAADEILRIMEGP